ADRVERGTVARSLPGTAVHDQILGSLRHVRIEVVHQHAERGLLNPAAARLHRAARGADDAGAAHAPSGSNAPARTPLVICSMSAVTGRPPSMASGAVP